MMILFSLHDALEALPEPRARNAYLTGLDGIAARLPRSMSLFCTDASVLLPAQRALLIFGGAPNRPTDVLDDMMHSIQQMTARDNSSTNSLLEAALSWSSGEGTGPLKPHQVPRSLMPMATALHLGALEMETSARLASALSLRPDLATAATLTMTLRLLTMPKIPMTSMIADRRIDTWLARRGVHDVIRRLLVLRTARSLLTDDHLEKAARDGIGRALALWVLGFRLSRGLPVRESEEALITALLSSPGSSEKERAKTERLWRALASRISEPS